jgi:prevent-host-death family protein
VEISVAEIRDNLADALNRVAYAGERVILQRRGKGVAALVSMEDLKLLEHIEDEHDLKEARKALAEPGPNIPFEQVKAELGLRGLGRGGVKAKASTKKRRKVKVKA